MGEPGGAVESEPLAATAVFGDRVDGARAYVELLATAGIERGLIGPRESGRLWSRHVLNCAVVAELVPAGARVVDIGSGAGLPGIPLAIARPDCRVDLVEPLERRAAFLAEAVERLGLTGCRVVRGRAEELAADPGLRGADVVTSRAVAPLGRLVAWSAPLARQGGVVLALKGTSASDEVIRDAAQLRAAGLADVEVIEIGAGIVDPPTWVVRGIVTAAGPTAARRARRPRPRGSR